MTVPTTPLQSAALFRRVLELRMQFLAILDPAGIVLEVNQAPVRLGFPREAFVGRHIGETPSFASDPEWVRTWDARLQEAALAGVALIYEDVFTAPDGSIRSANATLTPVIGEGAAVGDHPDCFLLEADDTTEQLQVELALRESERHFHDMAESLPVMAWTCDAAGVTDFVNARWTEYTGISAEQLKGWGWTDVIHPEDRARLAAIVSPSLDAGEPFETEYRVRDVDGAHRWFEMRMVPVRDAEGQVTRWYGAATDIHEAHELREALGRREAQLTAALAASGMAGFTVELATGEFRYESEVPELVAILPPDQLTDRGFEGFVARVHPDDRDRWNVAMGRAYDPATPSFAVAYRLVDVPGLWLESRGRVAFDDAGKPVSVAGVIFVREAPEA